jgi:hypothetical protein
MLKRVTAQAKRQSCEGLEVGEDCGARIGNNCGLRLRCG